MLWWILVRGTYPEVERNDLLSDENKFSVAKALGIVASHELAVVNKCLASTLEMSDDEERPAKKA